MPEEAKVEDKIAYAMAGVPQEEGNAGEETPAEETTSSETSQEEKPEEAGTTTPEGEQNEQAQETPDEQKVEEEPQEREYRPTRAERRIKNLLEENKRLKSSLTKRELPWHEGEEGNEPQVLTEEQLDEIIEQRLSAREELAEQRNMANDWVKDYEKTIKTNPELDPKSSSYNKELDELLSEFLTDSDGNPRYNIQVSVALSRLKTALENAKKVGAEKASIKLADQAEKGAITSGESGDAPKEDSWEDLDDLMKTDQQAYYRRLKEGKHPKI
jgi:ribonuclease HI